MIFEPRGRRLLIFVSLVLGGVLGGCNDATSTLGTLPSAAIMLTPIPDPIIATPSVDPVDFDYDISWSLRMTEEAGVGGTINFITANLYDTATGRVMLTVKHREGYIAHATFSQDEGGRWLLTAGGCRTSHG